MSFHLLADLTLLAHGIFILFVLCGGFAVMRWPRLAWLHLPAALWGAVVEVSGWICPLTPLENHFRRLAGESGYRGTFIEHYLQPLIYPDWLTPGVRIALGVAVIGINLALYARLWKKRR